jgi:hypothetical protein
MASARPGSDPPLAALLPVWAGDVRIGYGEVPTTFSDSVGRGVLYDVSSSALLLEIPDIARLHVARDAIIVAPLIPDAAAALGPHLRRTPLMALTLLRGGFACCGAAVAGPDGAVLLLGPTGAGKSTLAAALMKRGLRLLADDAAPLVLDEGGKAKVRPVWPELILWHDAARALFGEAPPWLQSSDGEIPVRKVTSAHFCAVDMPLKRIYVLSPDRLEDDIGQNSVSGFGRLLNGLLIPYQTEIAAALLDPTVLLRLYGAASAIAGTHTLKLLQRDVDEMNAHAERIMQDCGWLSAT